MGNISLSLYIRIVERDGETRLKFYNSALYKPLQCRGVVLVHVFSGALYFNDVDTKAPNLYDYSGTARVIVSDLTHIRFCLHRECYIRTLNRAYVKMGVTSVALAHSLWILRSATSYTVHTVR